jgi:hypothetical protein
MASVRRIVRKGNKSGSRARPTKQAYSIPPDSTVIELTDAEARHPSPMQQARVQCLCKISGSVSSTVRENFRLPMDDETLPTCIRCTLMSDCDAPLPRVAA